MQTSPAALKPRNPTNQRPRLLEPPKCSYSYKQKGYKNIVTNQPIYETSDTIHSKKNPFENHPLPFRKNYTKNIHPPHEVTETSHSFGWGTAALRISSLMLNPSGREYGLMRLVAPHFFASSWVLRFPNFHGIYDQEVKIKLICSFQQFCTSHYVASCTSISCRTARCQPKQNI